MNSKRGSQFLTILPRPISVCFLVFAYRSPGLQVFRRLSCVDHDCQQCSSPYLQDFYPIWDSVSFHFCLREASLAWNRGRVLESPCCTFLFRALPYFSQGGEEALLQRNVLRGAAVDSRGQPEATRGRAESMLWWCRWCRRCRGAVAQGRSNRASKWRQKSHSSWWHFFWKGDLSILWCTGFHSCRVKKEPGSVECWPFS